MFAECCTCIINFLLRFRWLRVIIFQCFYYKPPLPSYVLRKRTNKLTETSFFLEGSLQKTQSMMEIEYKNYRTRLITSRSCIDIDDAASLPRLPSMKRSSLRPLNVKIYDFNDQSSNIDYKQPQLIEDHINDSHQPHPTFSEPLEVKLLTNDNHLLDVYSNHSLTLRGYYLSFKNLQIGSILISHMQLNPSRQVSTKWVYFFSSHQVILFSHGNSSDIGMLLDHTIEIAYRTDTDIFLYDYPFFGQSSVGVEGEFDFISAIEAAYQFITKQLNYDQVIVYGYSLGSGPSLFLSAKYQVAGLVLHNAFYSMSSMIDKKFQVKYYEPFPNGELIKRIKVPVFIIHGTKDEVIPLQHGQNLASQAGINLFEFWPVIGANHGNVETRDEYFMKLELYFRRLSAIHDEGHRIDQKGDLEKLNHVYREYFNESGTSTSTIELRFSKQY